MMSIIGMHSDSDCRCSDGITLGYEIQQNASLKHVVAACFGSMSEDENRLNYEDQIAFVAPSGSN